MYVIFPADEVVYLSYGRLIYVPEAQAPPPTTSVPPSLPQATPRAPQAPPPLPQATPRAPEAPPPTTSGPPAAGRRPPRFNFRLLGRGEKAEPPPATPRVRVAVAPPPGAEREHTPPVEAFKRFCAVTPPEEEKKGGSKRSSVSSKEADSRDSKKSSSSKSTGKQNSAESSNNSSLKRPNNKKSPNHLKPLEDDSEAFYPLSTRREIPQEPVHPPHSASSSNKKLSPNSFRFPFRKDKTPDIPPVPPDRKNRRSSKEKDSRKVGGERRLSYSDYLAVSRERTAGDAGASSSDNIREIKVEKKKSEKSPVLRFFRRSSSPKNLGVNRTPVERGSPSPRSSGRQPVVNRSSASRRSTTPQQL